MDNRFLSISTEKVENRQSVFTSGSSPASNSSTVSRCCAESALTFARTCVGVAPGLFVMYRSERSRTSITPTISSQSGSSGQRHWDARSPRTRHVPVPERSRLALRAVPRDRSHRRHPRHPPRALAARRCAGTRRQSNRRSRYAGQSNFDTPDSGNYRRNWIRTVCQK